MKICKNVVLDMNIGSLMYILIIRIILRDIMELSALTIEDP